MLLSLPQIGGWMIFCSGLVAVIVFIRSNARSNYHHPDPIGLIFAIIASSVLYLVCIVVALVGLVFLFL